MARIPAAGVFYRLAAHSSQLGLQAVHLHKGVRQPDECSCGWNGLSQNR